MTTDRLRAVAGGLRIAHLQCHIGIDTLCLARRGASCVGLDFSPKAIAAAIKKGQEVPGAKLVQGVRLNVA